jgi:hypothetical protein
MNINDTELDQRLGALLQGSSLDLAPRQGATQTIVARVGRARRRRRAMLATAPVLAAAVITGAVLGGRGVLTGSGPVQPGHHQNGVRIELVMTGNAVGPLRLGMTRAQAEATGLLVGQGEARDQNHPACLYYQGRQGITNVEVGADGVQSIGVYAFIRNKEGIGIGDRYRDLIAAYPGSVPVNGPFQVAGYRVGVPGTSGAWYRFGLYEEDGASPPTPDSRIDELYLENGDPSCS